MDTNTRILKIFMILSAVLLGITSILNLVYGAEFPEGPLTPHDITNVARMDNIFRFYGGIIMGVTLIAIHLAYRVNEHHKIFYYFGLLLVVAGCARIISGILVGWPSQNHHLFNAPPFLMHTFPMIFEFSLGIGIIILQYLRDKTTTNQPKVRKKQKLDTLSLIQRILLITVIGFIGPASILNLIFGPVLPFGEGVYDFRMDNVFRSYGGILLGLAIFTIFLAVKVREHHRILYVFGALAILAGFGRLLSGWIYGWPDQPTVFGNVSPFLLYTIPTIFELVVGTALIVVQYFRDKQVQVA